MTRTGTRRVLGNQALPPFDFDLALSVFTPAMDKRLSPGPFYTAPIVQGDWDGTGTPDVVTFPRGDLLANQTQEFYANFDAHQFTALKWWTAETASADRAAGYSYVWYVSADYYARYDYANSRFEFRAGGVTHAQATAIISGTTYFIAFSADTKHSIDGTNECRSTINDVHSYSGTGLVASTPEATIAIGSDGATSSASAIIEGLTWYRRILTDGDGFGINIGVDDELADIFNAGVGSDPTLITGGAFDITACMPTNSTDEELVTSTGEMWSMPHADSIPDVTFNSDGGLPGTPYTVEFNATTTAVDCGSGITLDDIASGGDITVDVAFRADSAGEGTAGSFFSKWASTGNGGYSARFNGAGNLLRVLVECDNTNAEATINTATAFGIDTLADGKFHVVTVHYEDTTKWISVAVDGLWPAAYSGRIQGVGAYTSDAAHNFRVGVANQAHAQAFDGGIAWWEVWDNDHHTAGTDFIAPRAPTAAGPANLIETWWADEGTGVTVAARVTAPANNGTIANGSWSSIWEVEGTPVIPQSLEFFQENDGIDFGSGVNIDNLPSADCTIEFWARIPPDISDGTWIISKSDSVVGWEVFTDATGIEFRFDHASDFDVNVPLGKDNIWHHWAVDWDQGTLTGRVFLDGIFQGTDTAIGAYGVDAVWDCLVNAYNAIGTGDGAFAIGWIRLSDNRRYTGNSFVPDDRVNPPANDGNAHLLINMDDGAGANATDTSGNGYNGTITFGATTKWHNTPDMETDEPGARVFNGGYNIGSDGANDGITIIEGVTAETDYVNRLFISPGQSGRAWPEVYLWDNVGAAQIGATYSLPRCHDVHTGGNNLATLINANGAFTQQLVDWELYNVTDGSSTTVTAVSGDQTTITGVLAGGTDNDWDTNDVYILRPPGNASYCRYPFATESIFVFRTPAGCTSMDIKMRNAAGEGVAQVHQWECYESLFDGGDHEAGAGNPFILTGWANSDLDVGDTEAEAVVVHAGAQSVEWNVGAAAEGMRLLLTGTVDRYYTGGIWCYGDGAKSIGLQTLSVVRGVLQYSATAYDLAGNTATVWAHRGGVWRCTNGGGALFQWRMYAQNGATGDRWTDDIYLFALDSITITVVPANQANSLEGTGIRNDGRDTLSQPIPVGFLSAGAGWIRWRVIPRHDAAEAVAFGTGAAEAYWGHFWFDATRYIAAYWSAANTFTLEFDDGGGAHVANWNAVGAIVAGTPYLLEVLYPGAWMRLYVDGIAQAEIVTPINFTAIPNNAYWLHRQAGDRQGDSVVASP